MRGIRINQIIIASFIGVLFFVVWLGVSVTAANGRSAVPPVILNVSPQPNTHTVPVTSSIIAFYDQPIDPATVNSRTIVVHAMQTGLLTEVYGVSGGEVSFTPVLPLKPGELVQVIATTGTENFGGEGPITPTTWQFRAEAPTGTGIFTKTSQTLTFSVDFFRDSMPLFNSENNQQGLEIYVGVDVGDVDQDSDLDVVIGTSNEVRIFLNDGSGYFTDSGQVLDHGHVTAVDLGDFDNDGDLDLFVLNGGLGVSIPPKVWLNDGMGNFTLLMQTLPPVFANDGVLGDVNGDGSLDVVIADHSDKTQVWLNNDSGYFFPSAQLSETNSTYGVGLGDLDNDGDLDIFSVTWEEDQVWLNIGDGSFQSTGQLLGNSSNAGIALGDLDGDNDLDAFAMGFGTFSIPTVTHKVWINNGDGTFQENGQSLIGHYSFDGDVTLGDFDADGDLDALVGTDDIQFGSSPSGQFNELWINDGGGQFTLSQQSLGFDNSRAVSLNDLDADGDLDAILGTYDYEESCNCIVVELKIWLNEDTIIPISGFSAESNSPVVLGETANMTATITAGNGVGYFWSFGDGNSGIGRFVTHYYTETGVYTVVAKAMNGVSTVTTTLSVTVTDQPISGLNVESNSPVEVGEAAVMTATVATGTGVNYQWDFGDGNGGSGPNVSHNYLEAGVYNVVVTATNDANTLSTAIAVTVTDQPILGLMSESNSPVYLGEMVMLTATVSSGTGISYSWDFGDGSSGVGSNVTHIYTETGTYSVTVTATNSVSMELVTIAVVVTEEMTPYTIYLPVAIKP